MAGLGVHPFLFLIMSLLAVAEMGITASFIDHYNHTGWPEFGRFYTVIIVFMVTSVWTAIFAFLYMFWLWDRPEPWEQERESCTSPAGLTVWFIITLILWIVPTVLFFTKFQSKTCDNKIYQKCTMITAMTIIGWIEFALTVVTMIATLVWAVSYRRVIRGPAVIVPSPYPVAVAPQSAYGY